MKVGLRRLTCTHKNRLGVRQLAYVTKNIQSPSTLMKLAQHAFPEKKLDNVHELTEGYFNIAYEVSFQDGTESI